MMHPTGEATGVRTPGAHTHSPRGEERLPKFQGVRLFAAVAVLSFTTHGHSAAPLVDPPEKPRTPPVAYPPSDGGPCRSALWFGDPTSTAEPSQNPAVGSTAGGLCGDILLTQTTSDAITAGTACSLQAPDFSFCASDANSFARTFNLAADVRTAGKPFAVDCVEFGVRSNTTLNNPAQACQPNGPGGDFVVAVNVYRDTNGGAPTNHGVDLELLGGVGLVIPFGTQNQGFGVQFDPAIQVPADSQLVLEVFAPTRLPRFGGDGGLFLAGFNTSGQTTPGFLKSPNCGQNSFTSLGSLLPGAALVLQARGHSRKLEFVDPVPDLFIDAGPGAPIHQFIDTSDYAVLGTRGRAVTGVAADGLTPVLLRAKVGGPGSVRFDLSDVSATGENVGTLSLLDGTNVGTSVTAPVVFFTIDGVTVTYMAFALYHAPMDFCTTPSSPAALLDRRGIEVDTVFFPETGPSEPVETRTLNVVRPPVVLLHGLHDFGSSWQWFMRFDGRFVVVTPDYSATHGHHFLTNRFQLRHGVADALTKLRSMGVAATAADAFGHSMGGILSRLYMSNRITVAGVTYETGYRSPDNFHRGDVHKLISVNTPHYGSPVSDMLTLPDGSESRAGFIARRFSGRCIDCGAVFDLRTDSAVLRALNAMFVPVPAHAIWGDGASFTPDNYYTKDKASSAAWCGVSLETLMSGPSDAVVPIVSQQMSLPLEQRSKVALAEGLHWPVIHDYPGGDAATRAAELLDTATTDPTFASGFPTFTGSIPPGPTCHITLIGSPATAGDPRGMEFVSPAPGTVTAPGETVHVEAQAVGDFAPVRAFLTMVLSSGLADETIEVEGPPFSADFTVPVSQVGPVRFMALGIDTEGLGALTEPSIAESQIALDVTGLRLAEPTISLHAYAPEARATVLATFSDGIERVVNGATGLSFLSSDPSIAAVDADGMVLGRRVGATVVTASYGGRSARADIAVVSTRLDADSDGAIDLGDVGPSSSCLTGPQPNAATLPCLEFFDLDDDQDVDLADWAGFQNAF